MKSALLALALSVAGDAKNIVELAEETPQFSTLVGAVVAADLQHALDASTLAIANATMWDITFSSGHIYNDVTLTQKSLPLAATLKETDMVLHVPAGESLFGAWNASNIGWFSMPEEKIKHGDTSFTFTKDFHPFYGDAFDIMSSWAFPIMLPVFGLQPETTMYIAGRPKLQVLGIVHMDLKMGKNLTCKSLSIPPSQELEDLRELVRSDPTEETITMAARRLQDGGMGPVMMSCSDNGNLESGKLDELLSSFDRDRLVTTTTTTTTTTTAAPATTTTVNTIGAEVV